ncbi:hypothetical protein [Streptomyces mirabilis]|uniref:hypothetical protein n=1 Tax=Streptomyces mirabilis TaxID=68239 RepID=UPI0036584141
MQGATRAARIRVLSVIATGKFRQLRHTVDLSLAALALLRAAAVSLIRQRTAMTIPTRVDRTCASARIAMLALQQIEDDLAADDIGTVELAEILRDFHRELDPQSGVLGKLAQLLTRTAQTADRLNEDGDGELHDEAELLTDSVPLPSRGGSLTPKPREMSLCRPGPGRSQWPLDHEQREELDVMALPYYELAVPSSARSSPAQSRWSPRAFRRPLAGGRRMAIPQCCPSPPYRRLPARAWRGAPDALAIECSTGQMEHHTERHKAGVVGNPETAGDLRLPDHNSGTSTGSWPNPPAALRPLTPPPRQAQALLPARAGRRDFRTSQDLQLKSSSIR